ncbi:MAG: hypothetical protein HYT81_14230 [Gemmatimonadetes bacterium]|nr:hypothetical protein [Gemmatimonadota bacterium]
MLVGLLIYAIAVALSEVLDPTKAFRFSWTAARLAVKGTLPWFGAIFAGVYAAFYARFSSQWSYLAELYNQIKATEAQAPPTAAATIASWKAGFIEDADELHLAPKPMYAAIIRTWLSDAAVRNDFIEYAPGGQARLDSLMAVVNDVLAAYERRFVPRQIRRGKPQAGPGPDG